MNKKYLTTGIVILILLVVGFLIFSSGNNKNVTGDIINNPSLIGNPDKVTIYFFWGDGCPHCTAQKPYLEEWKKTYGDKIEVKMFETWKNPKNVDLLKEVAKAYGVQVQGVPTTFIGEKHWVGFSSSMAPDMEQYIQYCIENECGNPLTP
jgi:thiol-disulfide isomerase/thioredoxin